MIFQSNENERSNVKSKISQILSSTFGTGRDNYRQKRQVMRESEERDAVMYIPISASSDCPVGSNSVADASVTGISQVHYWGIKEPTYDVKLNI